MLKRLVDRNHKKKLRRYLIRWVQVSRDWILYHRNFKEWISTALKSARRRQCSLEQFIQLKRKKQIRKIFKRWNIYIRVKRNIRRKHRHLQSKIILAWMKFCKKSRGYRLRRQKQLRKGIAAHKALLIRANFSIWVRRCNFIGYM